MRPIRSTVPGDVGAVADRVAAAERPVEHDRQGGEQVGENALRGKADGDAADAEAGDQRGDVDPEIVEDDDQRDGEHGDADQHPDERHRIAERRCARIVADPARITPMMISRAQIATWSAAAMMNNMSARRASLGGMAA